MSYELIACLGNEVLTLMRILTGDRRFEEALNQYKGERDKTMCEVMETIFDIKEREVEKRVTERVTIQVTQQVTQQLAAQFEEKSAEYEQKIREHIQNEEALKREIAELRKLIAN